MRASSAHRLPSTNEAEATLCESSDKQSPRRYFIYALCDPRDQSIRYVGITKQPVKKRVSSHLKAARCGANLYCSCWLRQLLDEELRPLVVVLEETNDPQREAFWIEHFRKEGHRLTNLTSGGISGYSHSPEVRAKISSAGETRFKDLTGQVIGRLTVLDIESHKPLRWRCGCSCGRVTAISAQSFCSRRVQSCGCLNRELSAQRTKARARHGMWQSKEYLTWIEMRARCNNPKHSRYGCNGAKGIRVYPQWQRSFEQFLADMGPKPAGCVLMRRNPEQDYGPQNCCWATRSELRKQKR